MILPNEIFTIILEFSCDYHKHHLETHKKLLKSGLDKVYRINRGMVNYQYDDYGNTINYGNTIINYHVIWYLDYNNTRQGLDKSIIKFLHTNDIINSHNSFIELLPSGL